MIYFSGGQVLYRKKAIFRLRVVPLLLTTGFLCVQESPSGHGTPSSIRYGSAKGGGHGHFLVLGGAFRFHTQVRGIASTVIRPQNRLEGQDAAVLRHLEAQGVFQTEGAPACPAEGPFCELAPHFIIVEK